uniref:Uncharacterized protein n=1 Tax=mine drainage metagenome TaxID=410659 RepID=E6QRV3_9ZZZZ
MMRQWANTRYFTVKMRGLFTPPGNESLFWVILSNLCFILFWLKKMNIGVLRELKLYFPEQKTATFNLA